MIEYYISSTKYSLQERQTKLNGKVYDVVFRITTLTGEEKQKKLSGFKTKALAKEAHAEFITTKCELVKNNPLKKKNEKKDIFYVGDLVAQYLASLHNKCKESTIYDRTFVLRLFVLPYYEKSRIDSLTKQELYRWQDEVWKTKKPNKDEYYSHNYLMKIRRFFSTFLSWVESRYGFPNMLPEVEAPKRRIPKTEMQIWTQDEFEQLISVVDDPMYHCLFTFMFYTGRRKGEIFALTPNDVTETEIRFTKSVTVKTLDNSPYKVTSTKAEKKSSTPIYEPLAQELIAYQGQSPFFFGGERPLPPNTVTKRFQSYCRKANVKIIRIHDLRHSFVSLLIHNGANPTVVADLISDTLEQVTKTYAHMYAEDKITLLSRIKRPAT